MVPLAYYSLFLTCTYLSITGVNVMTTSVVVNLACYIVCVIGVIIALVLEDDLSYAIVSPSTIGNLTLMGFVIAGVNIASIISHDCEQGVGFLVILTLLYLLFTTIMLILVSFKHKRFNVFAMLILATTLACTANYWLKLKGWL